MSLINLYFFCNITLGEIVMQFQRNCAVKNHDGRIYMSLGVAHNRMKLVNNNEKQAVYHMIHDIGSILSATL